MGQILPRFKLKAELLSWYPRSRQRLFDTIRESGVEGLVFLSGDIHYAELSLVCRRDIGFPLLELTSSGITHSIARQLRFHVMQLAVYLFARDASEIQGPFLELNYGLLSFDWNAERDSPTVTLAVHDAHDEAVIHYTVSRKQLSRSSASGDFACLTHFEEDETIGWLLLHGWSKLYTLAALALTMLIGVPVLCAIQCWLCVWRRLRGSPTKEKPT